MWLIAGAVALAAVTAFLIWRGKSTGAPGQTLTLTQLVEQYNAPYQDDVRGALIHKIDVATAAAVAALIESEAQRTALPVPYLAGCIYQESRFDPQCYDRNLTPTQRTVTFEGTDWGICQFSGRYLADKPGMAGLSQDQMQTKACDAAWAIPVFADVMAGNVRWANEQIQNKVTDRDPYWLATLAYNAGNTGALQELASGQIRPHPDAVMKWVRLFESKLTPG